MKRLFFRICRLIYKFIGIFSPLFKMLVIHGELESLERNKKFAEARQIRHRNLQSFNKNYLAPLWRQEGFDLLYRIKDYPKSLTAFENAIETLELSAALYGVANPLDIYYGASMAAISANKKIEAQKYYTEFKKLYYQFSQNPKLQKAMRNYKEGMEWVESNLKQEPENK